MDKNETLEFFGMAKTGGEKLIKIDIPGADEDDYQVALSVEYITHRGKLYCGLGLDVRDPEGKPVDIDAKLLIGEELMDKILDDLPEGGLDEVIGDLMAEISSKVCAKEMVPAE